MIEFGAAISAVSTTVPVRSSRPLAPNNSLTTAGICGTSLWAFSRRRKRRIVVSSSSRVSQFRPCEIAQQRHIAQRLFRRRVAQREPLLREMDAQHGLDGKLRAFAFALRCRRRDQIDQCGAWRPARLRKSASRAGRKFQCGDRPKTPCLPVGSRWAANQLKQAPSRLEICLVQLCP